MEANVYSVIYRENVVKVNKPHDSGFSRLMKLTGIRNDETIRKAIKRLIGKKSIVDHCPNHSLDPIYTALPSKEVLLPRKKACVEIHPPQLVWAGKAEHTSFDVGVVSLHIHEWVSTSAILWAVCRPELLQLELFGETLLSTDREIEFYKHEVGWANCPILGDSLLIINSLLFKEGIVVKVC
jgi:hypothetical protein